MSPHVGMLPQLCMHGPLAVQARVFVFSPQWPYTLYLNAYAHVPLPGGACQVDTGNRAASGGFTRQHARRRPGRATRRAGERASMQQPGASAQHPVRQLYYRLACMGSAAFGAVG